MQHFFYVLKTLSLILLSFSHINAANKSSLKWSELPLSPKVKKTLFNQVYAKSKVKSLNKGKLQQLKLTVAGLHLKKCSIALSKISQYERYAEFISFIKKSHYDGKSQRLQVQMGHILMPFNMYLDFIMPRMTEPGHYSFTFTKGFLKSLKGTIQIGEHKKRCLFLLVVNWKGKRTTISNSIYSFFLDALGQRLIQSLFRISRTL